MRAKRVGIVDYIALPTRQRTHAGIPLLLVLGGRGNWAPSKVGQLASLLYRLIDEMTFSASSQFLTNGLHQIFVPLRKLPNTSEISQKDSRTESREMDLES